MASPTPSHYSILVDEEVVTAIPVPPRREYFILAITTPNIPGMELLPPVTTIPPPARSSELDQRTRDALERSAPTSPFTSFNNLQLAQNEPIEVQLVMAQGAARSAIRALTASETRRRGHVDEVIALTSQLAEARGECHCAAEHPPPEAAPSIVPGGDDTTRDTYSDEGSEVSLPEGWEGNRGQAPNFFIHFQDGQKVMAPYIKRLEGTSQILGTLGGSSDPYFSHELVAAPYGELTEFPEILPAWLVHLLGTDSAAFPTVLREAARLDDWGLVADLERYHALDARVRAISRQCEQLHAEESDILQQVRLCHYRLSRANAGTRLGGCEALDHDFQQGYPDGRPIEAFSHPRHKAQGRAFPKYEGDDIGLAQPGLPGGAFGASLQGPRREVVRGPASRCTSATGITCVSTV